MRLHDPIFDNSYINKVTINRHRRYMRVHTSRTKIRIMLQELFYFFKNYFRSLSHLKFFFAVANLSIINYARDLVTLANFLASHLAQESNFLSKKTC